MRNALGSVGFAVLVALSLPAAGSVAHFETPTGGMDVQLYDDDKPITVLNFIRYVQSGAYRNMFLHRSVPGSVIQGGGYFTTNRNEIGLATKFFIVPSNGRITNEFAIGQRLSNTYGTLAMVKDTSDPNSASSQWFFNLADNSASLDQLNGGYTVFGRVIQGTNVLEYFRGLETNGGGIVDMRFWYGSTWTAFSALPVNYTGVVPPFYPDLMYADITLANVIPRFTVARSVTGQGSIALAPDRSSYAQGTMVAVTATAAPGYRFTGWGGDLSGTNNPASLVINSNQSITAVFKRVWTLSVATNGSGHVFKSPEAVDYLDQSAVVLAAVADPGFMFTGWSGSVLSTDNPVTVAMTTNLTLVAYFQDMAPPVIAISSPIPGITQNESYYLGGTITDNVGVVSAHWELNGQPIAVLTLVNGQFRVNGLRLSRGANAIRVLAEDAAGNTGAREVVAVWSPARTFALVNPPAAQEGLLVDTPLQLSSPGDVSRMDLVVHFDTNFLRNPQVTWSPLLDSAVRQVDSSVAGALRLSFNRGSIAVPAGTNILAGLVFRTHSVPASMATDLDLELRSLSQTNGQPISFGTDLQAGTVQILKRQILGDNNGNNRLDVGDATLVQRLLGGLDPIQPWDTAANDLDHDSRLSSGDVTQILNTVVGVTSPLANDGQGILSPAAVTGSAGDLVSLQVLVQNRVGAISGASFQLDYPTNALRLLNGSAGPALVPNTAPVVWNVAPYPNDFLRQTGRVAFAASTPTPWPASNGTLAEFTFQVQPGALSQPSWLVRLSAFEITVDGYDSRSFSESIAVFTLRVPVNPFLSDIHRGPTGQGFGFTLNGATGRTYQIQGSEDLGAWQLLATYTNFSGTAVFFEPAFTNYQRRFYRAVMP